METLTIAKKIGGSIGVIIPEDIIKKEHIHINDTIKVSVERKDDVVFLWGKLKDIRLPTQKIMEITDEAEEL